MVMTTTVPATPSANPGPRSLDRPRTRGEIKRARIIDSAMRHFAEHSYQDARVSDIAPNWGVAKGSVFQHFGSKNGLFFEAYKKAVRSLPSYMHAPADVRAKGFFETLRYWLVRTQHLGRENWISLPGPLPR